VSEKNLRAAMVEANLELVEEAVAEGRLTQEQDHLIKQRIEERQILFPKLHRDQPLGQRIVRGSRAVTGAAAEVLGMEKGDLIAEVRSGKSLLQVALENGLTEEQFKADLLAQVQASLNELVVQEKLTGEQASCIFAGI
jgi:hypothetical protein